MVTGILWYGDEFHARRRTSGAIPELRCGISLGSIQGIHHAGCQALGESQFVLESAFA